MSDAVMVPRDEQGRTAYDIIRDANHASAMMRAGVKDRSREPLLGPPNDMTVSRIVLTERPEITPHDADILAVKINDALAASTPVGGWDREICTGCTASLSIADIKARGIVSCCPDRHMVRIGDLVDAYTARPPRITPQPAEGCSSNEGAGA